MIILKYRLIFIVLIKRKEIGQFPTLSLLEAGMVNMDQRTAAIEIFRYPGLGELKREEEKEIADRDL